ncbi:amidinotransferase [Cystobacter ferrugineus]|uniref:Amidinotransferase n=1 Tax=Cystobacter ferrugineus TaxID=83449 RepID=A0A1L9B8N6_9BACT|nr:amidinotransferase [Cystobacter ferrugineus]OJH38598.1 amidinotransferase [Cystobacter ferrugineus]
MDQPSKNTAEQNPVVNAYTEWDPLEEVIVGVVDNATFPDWHFSLKPVLPDNMVEFFQHNAGRPFPPERIAAAKQDLDELVHILEAEGVTVRRPTAMNFRRPFVTPHFSSSGGLYAAMPRDVLLVVGDEIIESPMAWRSRYYEPLAYRSLAKEYFRQGARWTAAPKPELPDELYDHDFVDPQDGEPMRYVINEYEPTFDAADFIKLGRDLIVQKSHVTNDFGIQWLQRHLQDRFRVHVFEFKDTHPMHIDATIMPLAPGKLLVNPERIGKVPSLFRGWDILEAPRPSIPDNHPLYMTSKWINMNLISLDEKRVVVERSDEPMISALRRWGFEPIPCNFRNFNTFGGSFHCATVDVRRRGGPVSLF